MLVLRLALLVGGVVALVLLIQEQGPEAVWQAIVASAPLLPIVILLEGAWVAWDVLAVRSLYGRAGRRVPPLMYLRSAMIAYPFMGLLPAGRAGAEAARATCLTPWVGAGRASAVAIQAQAAGLAGNFLMSAVGLFFVASMLGTAHWIFWGLVINGSLALVGSTVIFLAIRGRLGGWLGRKFRTLQQSGTTFDRHIRISPVFPPAAIIYSFVGRLTQGVQYVILVVAIGGWFGISAGVLAQSIHIIGALAGDLVPSQIGVTDGAYHLAAKDVAPWFGLATTATVGVFTIATLGRIAQIFWSIVGALTLLLWKVAPEVEARARTFGTSHFLEAVAGQPATDTEARTVDNTAAASARETAADD